MAVKNSTIITKAWLEGSNDFQQRVPNPDIAGYDAAVKGIFDPANNDLFNQFTGLLVGFMSTYVESRLFENPLRELKKPVAEWGNTERHVAVHYLKAHAYDIDDETLLKLEKPEFEQWFYSVNQHRRYEFSWSRFELMRAFNDGDSYGANDLFAATLDQMRSSDNYDEMNVMINAFAVADKNMNLYRHHLTSAPTTKELAQEMLVKIKSDAGVLRFPTTRYNHVPVPVHENSDTLILWTTPETDAYLDVMALAELFHVDRAEVNFRKVVIPEFPVPNVYAALTSEDFIYARDVWYGIEPPFYNPANRTYKYYLFHDQIIGVNPAANCILYTTDADTAVPTITVKPNGLRFEPAAYTVPVGGEVETRVLLDGTVAPNDTPITMQPNAATYTVAAMRTENDEANAVPLNSRTYVDYAGVLHVQKSGIKAGDVITVTAESAYTNPSGETETYTATATATVTDAPVDKTKTDFVDENPNLTYTQAPDTVYTPAADGD